MELDPTISTGVLADLAEREQEALAATWFTHWLSLSEPDADAATTKARDFMADIVGRSDLASLTRNPMLLVLLAQSWLHSGVLADNSFDAYASLVDHLHTHHPRLRANAASVRSGTSVLSNAERLSFVCFLAWQMQERGSYEIERESLRAVLVDHLRKEGFDAHESREISDAILGQASDAPAPPCASVV
jgi:hypothetical protein